MLCSLSYRGSQDLRRQGQLRKASLYVDTDRYRHTTRAAGPHGSRPRQSFVLISAVPCRLTATLGRIDPSQTSAADPRSSRDVNRMSWIG